MNSVRLILIKSYRAASSKRLITEVLFVHNQTNKSSYITKVAIAPKKLKTTTSYEPLLTIAKVKCSRLRHPASGDDEVNKVSHRFFVHEMVICPLDSTSLSRVSSATFVCRMMKQCLKLLCV